LTAEERAQVLVTARLLRAALRIDWLTTGLTLLACAALTVSAANRIAAIVVIALGLIAKLFAIRISFDASLFEDAASGTLTASDLDTALGALTLAPPAKAGRPWLDRCRGAKRLVYFLATAACTQTLAAMLKCVGTKLWGRLH
jgi:hypothetical protein